MHLTIPANQYIALKYRASEAGDVEFKVTADLPVKTYILRPKGLEYFASGSKTFKYYGGLQDARKLQQQRVWLPFSGPWFLVISNPDKHTSVEIDYEVFYY